MKSLKFRGQRSLKAQGQHTGVESCKIYSWGEGSIFHSLVHGSIMRTAHFRVLVYTVHSRLLTDVFTNIVTYQLITYSTYSHVNLTHRLELENNDKI